MGGKVLVAGAVGVIGRAVVDHLVTDPAWEVIGLSRRAPDQGTGGRHIAVDLLDAADTRAKLGGLADVTHIVFAAYQARADLAEQIPPNLGMLAHLVETVEAASPGLAHVTLMQGGKAYGCHLGPFRSPGKESDPRHMPPNFYYDQEDFLRAASAGKRWSWTALRPEAVCGFAVGNPMNLLMTIAVYAAICRELGVPLDFPGDAASYDALYQVTDARILARATAWAATTPGCRGEIFNITNGDYFRWSTMWPHLARFFGLELGNPRPIHLQTMMADKAPVWERIVARHGLKSIPFEQAASWGFGDFIFKTPYDNITSTIKARRFGFQDCIDSEEMFVEHLSSLRAQGVIPPA